jgi:hypothetical protein
MGDLATLLTELHAHRHRLTPPSTSWEKLDEHFQQVMPALPLFHRLGNPLREPNRSLAELSIRLEVAGPKSGRGHLGTDRCVFASFGVAAYLNPPVVLCFGPAEQVRPNRTSTPWDSRGVGPRAGWGSEYHAQMVAKYSLGAAEDESYLASYLATCFQSWATFLEGKPPVAVDPAYALVGAPKTATEDTVVLTTPEARFDMDLVLGEHLLACFVDEDSLNASPGASSWRQTCTALQRIVESRGGVYEPLRRYQFGHGMRHRTALFISQWLRDGGYLT